SQRWCRENFPPWENLSGQGANWPAALDEPVFPLAQVPLAGLLPPESAAEAMPLLDADEFEAPLLYSPLEDGYLVINGDPHAGPCGLLVRNLLLRALTALPAGKTQLCVIDPSGLGSDYGWLMHLGDFDPQLVSHRVWTQPGHIAQQLSQLAMAAEDFIQQALRNQYRTIVEYNREAGALAEPYRFLVWSSFPNGLEEASWKSLLSLLESGARCGIISILIVDPKSSWPTEEVRQRVDGGGLHVTWDATEERLIARAEAIAQCPLRLTDCPDDETARQVVHEVGRRAVLAHRVEVPLAGMLPPEEERWQGDSSLALSIPIGQSGVGRTHCLTLGLGTAQHAIIAGKTGSGKSSLLHAIISSAALKYSPQRLRLVLLDFKKGVEFQVYSDARLPHADIIGIESHREFGLSALEFVDGCMQRRGEMFRQGGVQDLASWNAMHPQQVLPRMLIVIDEFQEMFIE
ncbi:MAG: hypothetical protein KDA45_16975, partial [Planctomycetales bacterium]|nr:hypothetical protein [Planctomycetales bacterium]